LLIFTKLAIKIILIVTNPSNKVIVSY